jgi:mannose/fructose-specific phosphotransferase system component IIA
MSGITLHRTLDDLRDLLHDLNSPPVETLRAAVEKLRSCGDEGAELARVLDQKKTRLVFSELTAGATTLNVLNAILIEKSFDHATGDNFNVLVTLLAHEARHAEQRYFVDSIQQELHSYQTQVRVTEQLGLQPYAPMAELLKLGDSAMDLAKARGAIVNLFPGSPAQILYAALATQQPMGLIAIPAAIRQIRALTRAAAKVQAQ